VQSPELTSKTASMRQAPVSTAGIAHDECGRPSLLGVFDWLYFVTHRLLFATAATWSYGGGVGYQVGAAMTPWRLAIRTGLGLLTVSCVWL